MFKKSWSGNFMAWSSETGVDSKVPSTVCCILGVARKTNVPVFIMPCVGGSFVAGGTSSGEEQFVQLQFSGFQSDGAHTSWSRLQTQTCVAIISSSFSSGPKIKGEGSRKISMSASRKQIFSKPIS